MKFVDAYILAATKRKTRRIRTALVVIVSSLLFAVLFFLAFAAQGLVQSAKQVEDVGFNGRNLVSIMPSTMGFQDKGIDPSAKQKEIEAQMDAELKARKIKVTTELKQEDPSYSMEMGRRMSKFFSDIQDQDNKRVEDQALTLGKPVALYHFLSMPIDATNFGYQPDPAKDPLVEELVQKEETGVASPNSFKVGNGEVSYHMVEADMLASQLQPGQSFAWQEGQAYPVVISYNYMEKLAGKSFANVDSRVKVDGYRKLMKEFAGKELTYCYRNPTAQSRLQLVVAYNKTARTDKDNKTNPLDIPVCGGFDEALLKKLKIVQEEDKDKPKPAFPAPAEPAPLTKQVQLKIVGFVPAVTPYGQDIVTQAVSGLATLPVYSQNPIIFSSEVVNTDPLLKSLITPSDGGFSYQQVNLFADFATRDQQKAFIAQSCKGDECTKGERPIISSFGNVSVALEDIFKTITKFVLLGVLVIMIIAGLMIMFTISKVIADSTKEIAVFRALGARRRDIAHIYYTYGTMLTVSAAVLAIILATVGALVVTNMYGERIAMALVHGIGAYNIDVHVTLFGVRPAWLLLIAAAMALAALIGIGIPLLTSLRRKLITILREE